VHVEDKGDQIPRDDYGTRRVQDREEESERSNEVAYIPRSEGYTEVFGFSKLL